MPCLDMTINQAFFFFFFFEIVREQRREEGRGQTQAKVTRSFSEAEACVTLESGGGPGPRVGSN